MSLHYCLILSYQVYMGQPGFGKKWEISSLNLGKHSYCMGGPSIILSQPALRGKCICNY